MQTALVYVTLGRRMLVWGSQLMVAMVRPQIGASLRARLLGTTLEWIFGRAGPLPSAATPPEPMPQPHGNTDYEGYGSGSRGPKKPP